MIKKIITMLLLITSLAIFVRTFITGRAEAVPRTNNLSQMLGIDVGAGNSQAIRLSGTGQYNDHTWGIGHRIHATVNMETNWQMHLQTRMYMFDDFLVVSNFSTLAWDSDVRPGYTTYVMSWPVRHSRTLQASGDRMTVTASWFGPTSLVKRTFQGRELHSAFAVINPGDVLRWEFSLQDGMSTTEFWVNDLNLSIFSNLSPYILGEELRLVRDGISFEPPIITKNEDIRVQAPTLISSVPGVEARWYSSASFRIPDLGQVLDVTDTVGSGEDRLSTDGINFDVLGSQLRWYEVRDLDSLGDYWVDDTTFTQTSRKVTVFTDNKPLLTITYAAGAADANGITIPTGTLYSATSISPDFIGEEGWTNQPLNITVDADNLLGNFDTVLSITGLPDIVSASSTATRTNYHTPSADNTGTPVYGFLSEVGDISNKLSGTQDGLVKIDIVPPTASANHIGEFTFEDTSQDDVSGISTDRYKTQIAFTQPSPSTTPPTTGWEVLTEHTLGVSGLYDVWVRATDRAGNETTTKVYANLYVGGDVSITKNSDLGADLHVKDCANSAGIYGASDCEGGCSEGAQTTVGNATELTYLLNITNNSATNNAGGTFEDYLPLGITMDGTATISPASYGTITQELQTSGIYEGRWKISGTYANLEPSTTIIITIPCVVDNGADLFTGGEVLSNQASTDWTVGTGASALSDVSVSNFANHAFVTIGVETMFQKVGADDISTGLADAEFALYRWDVATGPSSTEVARLIDPTMVRDGEWQRVLENGETATDTNTHFVSDATGAVTLGTLEEGIYTLVETRAPSGYERPVGQWIMTIKPDNTDAGEDNYKIEFVGKSPSIMPPAAIRETSDGVHTYRIINARPFSIGMSGLEGTRGILLAGFVLMAVAGNAYLVYGYKQRKASRTTEQI